MMQLDYKIAWSPKRKKLTITVGRDRAVIVHAPEGTSEETVRRVIDAKRQWLYEKLRHPQKYRDQPPAPGKELVSGESMPYLGKNYRIELVDSDSKLICFDQKFFVPRSLESERQNAFRHWYEEKASERILPRVRQTAKALGVNVNDAKIIGSRFRWGSCTPKDNVNFNWRLIKAPMFVIDYVIVHELAHLIEPNHTPRFWNIVKAQVPGMEKAKAWLKEHGQFLEQDL
jgi:predicted metal-dependent hydrolase